MQNLQQVVQATGLLTVKSVRGQEFGIKLTRIEATAVLMTLKLKLESS